MSRRASKTTQEALLKTYDDRTEALISLYLKHSPKDSVTVEEFVCFRELAVAEVDAAAGNAEKPGTSRKQPEKAMAEEPGRKRKEAEPRDAEADGLRQTAKGGKEPAKDGASSAGKAENRMLADMLAMRG